MPASQGSIIAFLGHAGAHRGVPGYEGGPVARIDTHAARIFLAGTRALKLKRAVNLGYLDFSTIEKRRAMCETEIALNRRCAPELYVALRKVVHGAGGHLALVAPEAEGDPLDWVIEMRRFADGALLADVAARGELTPQLLRALADGIAAFHEAAEPVDDPHGAERLARIIAGNARAMGALGRLWPQAEAVRLQMASLVALDECAGLLDARAGSGHVRHCHGDLHLANICLWEGAPRLFDCIEFDAELARIDVLYDLAFLLMDLWQQGHFDAANRVFNRYLDMRAGEEGGVAALPLFLSVRSAIRAHVGGAAAKVLHGPARDRRLAEAQDYLRAAQGFLAPPQPRLIAIGGRSGTGKSTLASALAPVLGAPPGARWLRSDVIRKRQAGLVPEQRLPPESYTPESSAAIYAEMEARAEALLRAGWPVVVDAVFGKAEERAAIEAVAARAGAAFSGLWLEAPVDLAAQRVKGRHNDPSDADIAVVRAQRPSAPQPDTPWAHIDASGAREQTLAAARALVY